MMTKAIPYYLDQIFSNYAALKKKLENNRNYIELLYYDLSGVKGLDYTKEKRSFNREAQIERYYQISDQIEQIEEQNRIIDEYIKALDQVLTMVKDEKIRETITETRIKDYLFVSKY